MKLGLIQMPVHADKMQNAEYAAKEIARVKALGAELAVLPEMFCCPYQNDCFRPYAEPQGGPVWQRMRAAARENEIYLAAGSMPELDGDKVYNTSFVFDPCGNQIARHRKMHLFDINTPTQRFFESDTLAAGNEVTVFDSPFGKIGLAICFDIRFPEQFRLMALAGARLILVPAAFNMTTGPVHWEICYRIRAIDNQVFMVGVSSARDPEFSYVAYGNSLVVSPWGDILGRFDEKAASAVFEIDLDETARTRGQLPLLSGLRGDVYELVYKTGK